MVRYELGTLRPLILWRLPKQLRPRRYVFLLRPVSHPSHPAIPLVEEVHHTVSADPVLSNHVADDVRGHMALRLPQGMAVLPNKLHGHTHLPLLKLLRSDLQEAQWLSKEGAPERLSCIYKWTCKWDAVNGAHRTQEAEGGLTFEKPPPNSHCSVLANAARRFKYLLI